MLSWPFLAASWAPFGVQSPDSAALRDEAHSLQVRFERLRVRELPRTLGGRSRECDTTIGRLCIWDDGDDEWTPRPEPPTVGRARRELLAALADLANSIPGDHWILGQRMRYLAEAGRLEDAEALARACRAPDRWRCDAYLGFALHLQGRASSSAAFDRALAAMPTDLRTEWTDPTPLLDRSLREWIEDQPDSARAVARLWTLADPLFVVTGNDRWTGHLARRTYAMSSEAARNPHGMQWADDLTEAAARYGWSVAWEKGWPQGGSAAVPVVGRDPPAAYRTFPPADVLRTSKDDAVVAWEPPRGHARTAYLPPYLDSLGVLAGQVGRFWRRDGVLIVAAAAVPEWPDPPLGSAAPGAVPVVGEQPSVAGGGRPARRRPTAGLFLAGGGPADGDGLALDLRAVPDSTGAVRVAGKVAPTAWGVASLEIWDRDRRRAQRLRAGMSLGSVPPDVFAVSDLMLLEPLRRLSPSASASSSESVPSSTSEPVDGAGAPRASGLPTNFQEMVESLRLGTEAGGSEALGVAIEVYGLGYRSEAVGFRAWVEDPDPSALRRLARRLGLAGPAEKVAVQWTEAGPSRPGPLFRAFSLRLPGVDPGAWQVAVEVSVPGRAPLVRRRAFTVAESRPSRSPSPR